MGKTFFYFKVVQISNKRKWQAVVMYIGKSALVVCWLTVSTDYHHLTSVSFSDSFSVGITFLVILLYFYYLISYRVSHCLNFLSFFVALVSVSDNISPHHCFYRASHT